MKKFVLFNRLSNFKNGTKKYYLFSILSFLLFTNCEKDEIDLIEESTKTEEKFNESFIKTSGTIDDFSNDPLLKTSLNELEDIQGFSSGTLEIDPNRIVKLTNDKLKSYVFLLKKGDENSNTFKNIVFNFYNDHLVFSEIKSYEYNSIKKPKNISSSTVNYGCSNPDRDRLYQFANGDCGYFCYNMGSMNGYLTVYESAACNGTQIQFPTSRDFTEDPNHNGGGGSSGDGDIKFPPYPTYPEYPNYSEEELVARLLGCNTAETNFLVNDATSTFIDVLIHFIANNSENNTLNENAKEFGREIVYFFAYTNLNNPLPILTKYDIAYELIDFYNSKPSSDDLFNFGGSANNSINFNNLSEFLDFLNSKSSTIVDSQPACSSNSCIQLDFYLNSNSLNIGSITTIDSFSLNNLTLPFQYQFQSDVISTDLNNFNDITWESTETTTSSASNSLNITVNHEGYIIYPVKFYNISFIYKDKVNLKLSIFKVSGNIQSKQIVGF